MSLWHIAWSYLWNRRFTTSLTILSVALGVGLIYSVLTLREETRKRFEEEGQSFDVCVGAKGSPLQLVLSSMYYMDTPTGNILLSDCEHIRDHEDVAAAFPICMGDTYRGFRIVGTIRGLFDYTWTSPTTGEVRTPYRLAKGRYFEEPMEAVVGSTVARAENLAPGDTFIGTHGFVEDFGHKHGDSPYTVVGIMETSGTPNDRAVFCSMDSVWEVHAEHDRPAHEDEEEQAHHDGEDHHDDEDHHAHAASEEITAILVALESPALRFQFVEYVNDELNAMATIPIQQVANLYASILGTVKSVLLAVGYLVVVISAISILIGLYLSILQRKRDLAIMRALGASAGEIVGSVFIEALLVTVLGIIAGWLVGNAVCAGVGVYLTKNYGLTIGLFRMLTMEQIGAFAVVALVGLVAGIAPAWQAYGTDVARDLAEL